MQCIGRTSDRQKWEQYEAEKARIEAMLWAGRITFDEYDRLIRELCARLGV